MSRDSEYHYTFCTEYPRCGYGISVVLTTRYVLSRTDILCRYFFYKNTVFTLVQFWFNLYAAFSGQRFYDDWLQAFYNLLFTSLPVIALGLLDQDVSKVWCPSCTHQSQGGNYVDQLRSAKVL